MPCEDGCPDSYFLRNLSPVYIEMLATCRVVWLWLFGSSSECKQCRQRLKPTCSTTCLYMSSILLIVEPWFEPSLPVLAAGFFRARHGRGIERERERESERESNRMSHKNLRACELRLPSLVTAANVRTLSPMQVKEHARGGQFSRLQALMISCFETG